MANLVYCNDSNLYKNNYYYTLATELVPNLSPLYRLITQALPTLVPVASTSRPTPQLPTTTPKLRLLESAWPTVAPNAWWPVPPLHQHPLFLQQRCRGMSCLPSPIPSLAWGHLPTKIAKLFLLGPQSQSTTQMAIPSSQTGGMRLARTSGTFLSPPRPQTLRMQPLPQLLSLPS